MITEKIDAILESLQYLLSVEKPVKSERYNIKREKLMVENHLLLNPITDKTLPDKTKFALQKQND